MNSYPIDIITYIDSKNNLPDYLSKSLERTKSKGFDILDITPDNYNYVKPFHAGFKHIRDITIPKIEKIINNINGFFIAEGDLWLNDDFHFDNFITMNLQQPTWLGYKKKLSNYIVGNFLIYIPSTHFEQFKNYIQNQKRLIYSDRFFTKLYFDDWLHLHDKSVASEIVHYSNVLNGIRL